MGAVIEYSPRLRAKNLTGERVGRLKVLGLSGFCGIKNNVQMWLCLCDCGNEHLVRRDSLLCSAIRSCGCLRNETTIRRRRKHGLYKTKLYRVWASMVARCEDANQAGYRNYGGRGIGVCPEWREFLGFYAWAISGYRDGLSIDRIDVNGNYTPENCRWATSFVQAINKRKSQDHGIHLNKKTNKWIAAIKTMDGRKCLGSYESKEAAMAARRGAEIKYHEPYLTNEQLGITP